MKCRQRRLGLCLMQVGRNSGLDELQVGGALTGTGTGWVDGVMWVTGEEAVTGTGRRWSWLRQDWIGARAGSWWRVLGRS